MAQPPAAGRPPLCEDLAALYDAFETPRAVRGDLKFLAAPSCGVHEDVASAHRGAVSELHKLVVRHELEHTETMVKAMAMAGFPPPSFSGPRPR